MSWRTRNQIVGVSAEVKEHIKKCKAKITIGNFNIISEDDNSLNLKIKDSLFIKKDLPNLNKNVFFLHLFIYFNYLLYCTSFDGSYTTHLFYVSSLCFIYTIWFIHVIFNLFLLMSHFFVFFTHVFLLSFL